MNMSPRKDGQRAPGGFPTFSQLCAAYPQRLVPVFKCKGNADSILDCFSFGSGTTLKINCTFLFAFVFNCILLLGLCSFMKVLVKDRSRDR